MKIWGNWGLGIIIVWIGFLIIVVSTIIFTLSVPKDLVETNYYSQGLDYQKKIDKKTRFNNLKIKPNLAFSNKQLTLQFPNIYNYSDISGTITLYRPSDSNKDKTLQLQLAQNGIQNIDMNNIDKGKWLVKIDWANKDTTYYFEEEVNN
jgi:nitrogen fixation protein FixH